ncbi:hypothetical protein KUTeg_019579 [Tegillarca granosa]|uniref:RING-type domain-containing protein n=1 Tax=Tegillarca granosa TaxID=220873 RepID=A0ABQ9ECY4_TEGGR|nr:hypothetical protein KUTeg_019579 [Tegillarca granosa]
MFTYVDVNKTITSQKSNEEACESIVCDICGDNTAQFVCEICDNKQLCQACDTKWHKHPKRQNHQRKNLLEKTSGPDVLQSTSSGASKENMDLDEKYVTAQYDLLPAHVAGMRIEDVDDTSKNQVGQTLSGQSQVQTRQAALPMPQQQQQQQGAFTRFPSDTGKQHISMTGASNTSNAHTLPTMHQSQGEPQFRTLPKTAPGGPPLSKSSSSKFLPKIMAVTDLQKRRSKAEVIIETIQEEIDELEEKIQKLIEENEAFYEDAEYGTLLRKKGMLQREKVDVNKYMKELDGMISGSAKTASGLQRETGSSLSSQHIFYPPPLQPFSTGIDNSLMNMQLQQPQPYSPVSFHHPQGNIYPNYVYVQQPDGQQVPMPAVALSTSGQTYMPITPLQSIPTSIPPHSQGYFYGGQTYQHQQPYNPEIYSNLRHLGQQVHPEQGQLQEMYEKSQGQVMQVKPIQSGQHHLTDKSLEENVQTAAMETTTKKKSPEQQRERSRSSSEETQVMEMAAHAGRRIAELQDEIYWEKQEAKKRFAEQMEREKQQAKQKQKSQEEEKIQAKPVEEIKKEQIKQVVSPIKPMPVSSPYTSQSSQPDKEKTEGSPSTRQKPTFNFTETMEQIQLKREQEQFIIDGKDLINVIKTADKNGYDIEEVQIALLKSTQEQISPIDWLTENWQNTIDYVVTMGTNEGSKMNQNEVGELSTQEAKEALKEHAGNVQAAIQHCVERRTKLFEEISKMGMFPREEILQAMLHSHGDFNAAMDELNGINLQTFLDRIWLSDNINQHAAQGIRGGDDAEGAGVLAMPRHDSCVSVTNSVLTHTDFQELVRSKDIDLQRRIRMILVEGRLQSWGRAATVIKILDHDVADKTLEAELEDIVEAVRNCGDRQSSLIYLQQDCDCCYGKFPMSKIRSLGNCECKICIDCMKGYFEVTIRERHVRNLSCPLCGQPDMEDIEAASEYLGFLTMLLQTMVSQEILDLYQTKLRDWHLQKDPNFRWCTHCGNGFIWGIGRQRLGMQCPTCNKKTCFLCKKQWEDQHEGLTCEEYNQWKIDNDPENQAAGLSKHLELNGIDCPSCKMSYSLAKGGCMHFTCPQCGHEFCSGCSQPFDSKGDNKIQFDKKVPDNQEDKQHCPVMEQKEYTEGKQDEACGKDIEEGHAGLCLLHYKEYLVGLIRQHKIDPVAIMTLDEMINLLKREEKHVSQRKQQETDPQYRKRLKQSIKEKIPLKR